MRFHLKIVGALAVALSISPSFAEKPKGYTYLALGDSIPYGFDPIQFTAGLPPLQFIGYPEIVARVKRLRHVNAACPGETSGSFISGVMDFGCNDASLERPIAFKPNNLLHTNYSVPQLAFALGQLRANKRIDLITLSLGGNDLSLLQAGCAVDPATFSDCVRDRLPTVLGYYAGNLARILGDLRNQESYKGKLVLVTNYSPSANPLVTEAIFALNQTMIAVGRNFEVTVAEGFGAFQLASASFGGDPCKAGLLVPLSFSGSTPAVCDIHPSEYGQNLLAATILFAADKKSKIKDNDD